MKFRVGYVIEQDGQDLTERLAGSSPAYTDWKEAPQTFGVALGDTVLNGTTVHLMSWLEYVGGVKKALVVSPQDMSAWVGLRPLRLKMGENEVTLAAPMLKRSMKLGQAGKVQVQVV